MCIHPVTICTDVTRRLFKLGFLKTTSMEVPCGKCLQCKIAKQSALIFLANKELQTVYRSSRGASFVTLTYDDKHIPINDKGYLTLNYKHVQKFMKNVRRQMDYHNDKTPFKYVLAGEYGDSFGRPHYHIVFLGLSDNQVIKYTRKLWKYGLCDVGALAQGGLRYVCKYMTKSIPSSEVKLIYDSRNVEKPFVHHSIGLGKQWIISHIQQIADNNYMFEINGKKQFFPKSVMRFVSVRTGKDYRPIVSKYINSQLFRNNDWSTFNDPFEYAKEQNYIRYRNNIATMRSKGIAVDDELAKSKKWIRAFSRADRNLIKALSTQAMNVAYGVPF